MVGLARDLARSLSVISVRVVENIAGKTFIGLEIPNEQRESVYLLEGLASEIYESSKSPLTLVLGKDISGQPVVDDLCKMPHLLVAGPTGSGKTTAIYASIGHLLEKHQNAVAIASVEDPVEQNLMWVNQSALNPARDYTYVAAPRSLMRQDPEVIMIGEIRDVDTATIAVTAGMTGHLVISTIHSGTTSGTSGTSPVLQPHMASMRCSAAAGTRRRPWRA